MAWKRVLKFVFGARARWEYVYAAANISAVAVALIGITLLLNSEYKRFAAVAAWLLIFGVLVSIVYAYRRRWRDTQRQGDKS